MKFQSVPSVRAETIEVGRVDLNCFNRDDKLRRKGQTVRAAFADPRPPRTREPVPAFKPGGVLWNPKLYYAIVEGQEPVSTGGRDEKKTNLSESKNDEVSPTDSLVERPRTYSANSEELSSSEKSSSNENMSIIPKFVRQSSRRILKPVHYPFATPTPKSELVNFYRECSHAPPLVSLSETTPSIKDITEQLVAFEMKAKEFDEMVKSLCDSPDSDN
ncbi:hypothetical protein HHI36_020134 [Cryptolaemus montrouzieri]|uniref:Uncharacterized protein n=1 Tax=Cryptolaemus montrouzieri TaxID=559131 RepID=A0ABD2NA38_9CUCU